MRIYASFKNSKENINIDHITFKNLITNEILNLSLTETDSSLGIDNTCCIRQKNEESDIFGLPDSLKNCFGNNKQTANFIKNSKVISITLCDIDKELNNDFCLDMLLINIGDINIEINDLNDIKIDELNGE